MPTPQTNLTFVGWAEEPVLFIIAQLMSMYLWAEYLRTSVVFLPSILGAISTLD